MAMIRGHDYVVVTHWECPYCHHYHGNLKTMIGRYPAGRKLTCQECYQAWFPGQANDVGYASPPILPLKRKDKI